MRISIAMCTYNGGPYLQEQLDSIASQTLLPFELVVCDDRSSDLTLQILETFAQNAPFQVRVFKNETNLGYVKNFERAISLCQGDIIALSDQDDMWYPHKLKELSVFFQQDSSVGGVFSDGDLMDFRSKPIPGSLWNSFMFNNKEQAAFRLGRGLEVLLRRNVVTGMTFMFRAELRDRLLPIPPSWEHDAWIAMMLCLYSKLEFSSIRLVRYRTHQRQEIGVPLTLAEKSRWIIDNGVSAYLSRTRDRNVTEYKQHFEKYDDLSKYVANRQPETDNKSLQQILGKVKHTHLALTSLSKTRIERFRETLSQSRNYKTYSALGLRAMLRDLII